MKDKKNKSNMLKTSIFIKNRVNISNCVFCKESICKCTIVNVFVKESFLFEKKHFSSIAKSKDLRTAYNNDFLNNYRKLPHVLDLHNKVKDIFVYAKEIYIFPWHKQLISFFNVKEHAKINKKS